MVQSKFHCWLLMHLNLLILSCLLGLAEGQTCRDNYTILADALLNNGDNKYQLSVVFFPTDRTPPSFVNVTYQYGDTNIANETWLWSSGAFYFFQPLRIYQFSSLFFGIPHFRSDDITLVLPADCANARVQIMETLTQRLKLIASSQVAYPTVTDAYQAKATSMNTVKDSYYNRDNAEILSLIYVVQVFFPILSTAFFIACFIYYQVSKKGSSQTTSEKDWSTTAAYYGVSLYFTLFVFCLDCAAVHYRTIGAEFILISNENLKNLVIVPIVFDSLAVVFIVVLVFITGECICCRCCYMKGEGEGGTTNNKCCNITDENYIKVQFICLSLAGLAPLLCITSHAHFILIAWITNPGYASGVGIFYGILVFICFLTFKCVYYHVCLFLSWIFPPPQNGVPPQQGNSMPSQQEIGPSSQHENGASSQQENGPSSQHENGASSQQENGASSQRENARLCACLCAHARLCAHECCVHFCHGETDIKEYPSISCAALLITLVIGILPTGWLAMMACFFIYIPINNAIEDTPTQVYAIYQGIIAVLTALLAYIVIVKPRSFSIKNAVKKALKKIGEKKDQTDLNNKKDWKDIDDEEKLAEVLTMAVKNYALPA